MIRNMLPKPGDESSSENFKSPEALAVDFMLGNIEQHEMESILTKADPLYLDAVYWKTKSVLESLRPTSHPGGDPQQVHPNALESLGLTQDQMNDADFIDRLEKRALWLRDKEWQ